MVVIIIYVFLVIRLIKKKLMLLTSVEQIIHNIRRVKIVNQSTDIQARQDIIMLGHGGAQDEGMNEAEE